MRRQLVQDDRGNHRAVLLGGAAAGGGTGFLLIVASLDLSLAIAIEASLSLDRPASSSNGVVVHRVTMHYMSHPLSVRLNDATIARLGRHAQRAHLAPRTLAQRYVEEGLRMDEHPLIRFADGPAGRRARLVGTGKDVWEIIAAVRDNDGDAAETARYLEIPLGLVQAAISYYGAYREEIDQWIEVNEQQAAEAHAAWSAGQDAIRP
jgi:uncharacterized protein (DUF433 family)